MEDFLYSPEFRTLLDVTATFSQGYISGKISEFISKFQQDTAEAKRLRKKYAQLIDNDHLQRAVRKAQLYATLRVLEKATEEAPDHENSFQKIKKAFNDEIKALNKGKSVLAYQAYTDTETIQKIATKIQGRAGSDLKVMTLVEINEHFDEDFSEAYVVIENLLLEGWQDDTHTFDWFVAFSNYFAELRHDYPEVKNAFDDHFLTGIANQLDLDHAEVLASIDNSTQAIQQAVQDDGSLTRDKLAELAAQNGVIAKLLETLLQKTTEPAWKLPEAALEPNAQHLPERDSDFVFPLSLGAEVEVRVSGKHDEEHLTPYETYFYSEDKTVYFGRKFEIQDADDVLVEWFKQPKIHVITGEPGSGKTTLLSDLARRLHEEYLQDNTQSFPLYVPLRRLNKLDLKSVKNEGFQNHFSRKAWGYEINVAPYERGDKEAIWLLDGWDELQDCREEWKENIAGLQGIVIVSCRIAQYNDDFGKGHVIMGLNQKEQVAFLEQLTATSADFDDGSGEWRRGLVDKVNKSVYLRQLAANPLLLHLIALTHPPHEYPSGDVPLPNKRADFYKKAVEVRIKRRLDLQKRDSIKLKKLFEEIAKRAALTLDISDEIFVDAVEAVKAPDNFEKRIENNGILSLKEKGCQFLHATFQEWYLAQALGRSNTLVEAVRTYWQRPIYEETLALLWGMKPAPEQLEATEYLLQVGCQPQQDANGQDQPTRRRSGMRTALHLWQRSGLAVEQASLKKLRKILEVDQKAKRLCAFAIASDSDVPVEILTRLANDDDLDVRRAVVENANTPPDALVSLANDDYWGVRRAVAGNANTPPDVLVSLANNDDSDVRRAVARNANTPPDVLVSLANDDDSDVRKAVAENANIPPDVLVSLANDDDSDMRRVVAENANTPPDALVSLANDDDSDMRRVVAENANTPPDALVSLANDDNSYVRGVVAGNANTPPDALVSLANDDDSSVRKAVAGNANICLEHL